MRPIGLVLVLAARRVPAARVVLGVASLGVFMAFVDATIVNIAFPDIERSFPSASTSSLSWVLNAYNIVFAAFLVSGGRLADLLGRRRVFLVALVLFTFGSALCALAPSALALIGFRVVQALGAALLVPSSLALVLEAFAPERRAHAVALFSAVGALAAGVGPSLGGVLVSVADWRLVFVVNLPIGIAAFGFSRRALIESRAPGRRRVPDLAGGLLLAIAIATLVLGVVKGQDWGWGNVRVVGSFFASAAVIGLFVWRCSWHRSPLINLTLLRARTFSTANALTVVAGAAFFGYTLVNVLFLTGVWRYSILDAGLAITPGPFVAAAVAGPTSRLTERIGYRPVLVAGGIFWGGALFWFVQRTTVTPDYLGRWLPGMILLGIGAGAFFPNLSAAAVASAPGESFATATSLNSVARQVGAALGVAIVVAIIGMPSAAQALGAFHAAWRFAAVALIAAGVGCLGIGRLRAGAEALEVPSLGRAARELLGRELAPAPATGPAPVPRVATDTRGPSVTGRPESTIDFLAGVPIFAGLAPAMLEQLAGAVRAARLNAGEWLFEEGDPGEELFIVRAGRLEVVNRVTCAVLRVIARGGVVGELSLLSSQPRSVSVRAARASDLIVVSRDDFERLLREQPEFSLSLTRAIAGQLRETRAASEQPRPRPVAIALVPLDRGVPLALIAEKLAGAMSRYAAVTTVDGSEVTAVNGTSGAVPSYAPLVDRCAAGNDHVLMVAQDPWAGDAWTGFCLQQADRILAFGSGSAPSDVRQLLELHGCDLVGWDVGPGSGSLAGWAQELDPLEAHALRPGPELDRDVSRMARRLTGHSVGIVLSGGGARAFSHIGVIEELAAAGIRLDRVAGTSMGAFVGALLAMGLEPQEIDARCFEEWVRRSPLTDYTFPRHALLRGRRAHAMLDRTVGNIAIEELELGFFCCCADLRTGEAMLSRWGSLHDALAQSMSIPVLAPPIVRGRSLLVDGALVDNLPVPAMAALSEGPIISVDVRATLPQASDAGAKTEVRFPSLGETLMRVMFLGSAEASSRARRIADLTIQPRTDGIGLLEFHQLDRARESGRAAARQALENAPAILFG